VDTILLLDWRDRARERERERADADVKIKKENFKSAKEKS
jgi:hypothetical protein